MTTTNPYPDVPLPAGNDHGIWRLPTEANRLVPDGTKAFGG